MRGTLAVIALGWACVLGACGDDAKPVDPAPSAALPRVTDPPSLAPVARVETADDWHDLVAQRPSAVQRWGGAVVVDLGHEQARKHLDPTGRGQWMLGQDVDGTRAGVVVGLSASLDLPVDGDLAPGLHLPVDGRPPLAVAMRVKALVADQTMTVLWNERPLAHLQIGTQWQRRTLSLPVDLVRPGENRLRFHFRRTANWRDGVSASAAVSAVELGTHARIVEPPEPRERPMYDLEPDASGGSTLRIPAGAGLVWYATAPPRGKLVVSARGNGALGVVVSTDADHAAGRKPTVLLEEPLRETGKRSRLDLSPWGGVPIRIEVHVRGRDVEAHANLEELRISVDRSRPVDGRPRRPRDVVLVCVEGLRSDALALGRWPELPRIEALARRSVTFERAYALSPSAVPSHAAWMTSVVPPAHLTIAGTFVADGRTTFAESLARSSYLRAIVSANADVDEERGLVQGFDVRRTLGGEVEDDSAVAVVRDLLRLAAEHRGRVLLMANLNDPQAPYEPPRDHVRDLVPPPGAPMPHLTHVWVGRVRLGKHQPTAAELAYVRALYRAEVRVVDEAIGELVDALEAKGRLEEAIVVLVGIHGEEFFEHGSAGHGHALHEESLRVPLLIHAPDLLAAGRVTVPVDLLDLTPTLADLLGLAPADSWQGRSLLEVVDDPIPPPRMVVAYMGDGRRAAIVGTSKYVLGPGKTEAYFDLAADPLEVEDRIGTPGIGVRIVRTALIWELTHEGQWRRARWGTGANLAPAFALDQGM
jgi:hypothetical protein